MPVESDGRASSVHKGSQRSRWGGPEAGTLLAWRALVGDQGGAGGGLCVRAASLVGNSVSWEGLGCVLAGFHVEGQAAAPEGTLAASLPAVPSEAPFRAGLHAASSSSVCPPGSSANAGVAWHKCVPCRGLSQE